MRFQFVNTMMLHMYPFVELGSLFYGRFAANEKSVRYKM